MKEAAVKIDHLPQGIIWFTLLRKGSFTGVNVG